jgi:hypothetical protein
VNSILFLGGATLATSATALIGVGEQEAYELLLTWGFTFYGVAYLALFAIPLFGRSDRGIRPGIALQIAAASGFIVTLLFVILSIFPVIRVENESSYSWKIAGGVVIACSWLDYISRRKAQSGGLAGCGKTNGECNPFLRPSLFAAFLCRKSRFSVLF